MTASCLPFYSVDVVFVLLYVFSQELTFHISASHLSTFDIFSCSEEKQLFVHLWCCFFPGAWTFLWFVCFCLLASQWARTHDISSVPEDAARATVAFSFFSIATWVSCTAVLFCLTLCFLLSSDMS